jgi:copper chaperone
MMKESEMIEFQTEGMSCGHCVKKVTQALQAVDAAARVEVDLATQKVRVESSANRADLVAAMDDAGYSVLG